MWNNIRKLDHMALFGKYCTSSNFISGEEGLVGAIKEFTYADYSTWKVLIKSIDDDNHSIS